MARYTSAEAYAPASMANLGIGFDILGLALSKRGDTVRAVYCDEPGVRIAAIHGDDGLLPRDPAKNTASVAAMAFLEQINATWGVDLHISKGLPLASGLGSSAASAVAGVVAVNALLESPLPKGDLLPACMEGEALISGYHADNIAPCLLGGMLLIGGLTADQVHTLPIPQNLHLAVMTPAVEVPTVEARAVLPQAVPLKTVVKQTSGVAQLIRAIYREDINAMAAAMESDAIIEPARAALIPLLDDARRIAKAKGALGLVISGAGPTLCGVCADADIAMAVATALQACYDDAGIGGESLVTSVDRDGAKVISCL